MGGGGVVGVSSGCSGLVPSEKRTLLTDAPAVAPSDSASDEKGSYNTWTTLSDALLICYALNSNFK